MPEHPALIEGGKQDAAAYRQEAGSRLTTLRYGDGERHVIDLFAPEQDSGGTAVFIHGGYWQALDRSFVSHLARGLNVHGITVAIPSYDLCPYVRVGNIVDQLRQVCRVLSARGRLIVSGHSAGGHLAACLLATDWAALGLRADLVPAAYAISGLFDLEPLRFTYVNDAVRMSEPEARQLSPLFWSPPVSRVFDAVVGGDESSEFLRQSRTIVEAWGAAGVKTRFETIPDANHFTVIDPLADPGSAITKRMVDLVRTA